MSAIRKRCNQTRRKEVQTGERTESDVNDGHEKLCEEETGCDQVTSNKGGRVGFFVGSVLRERKQQQKSKAKQIWNEGSSNAQK